MLRWPSGVTAIMEVAVEALHWPLPLWNATPVAAMDAPMRAHHIREVWVLADNDDAIAFYRACGFMVPDGQATYMTRD